MFSLSPAQRQWLFWGGCMVARLLPFFVMRLYPATKMVWGIVYAILGASFAYTFLFSKAPTGVFGGRIWWGNVRAVHAFMYVAFAVTTLFRFFPHTEFILLADTGLGALFYLLLS